MINPPDFSQEKPELIEELGHQWLRLIEQLRLEASSRGCKLEHMITEREAHIMFTGWFLRHTAGDK